MTISCHKYEPLQILVPSNESLMHEELKTVLTMFREKRRKLDIHKTPEVYIHQQSSVEEVQEWLREKGFSERYNILSVYTKSTYILV